MEKVVFSLPQTIKKQEKQRMRILLLGSGGREHALYLKLRESPLLEKIFVWPGNGLIAREDRVNAPAVVDNFSALEAFIEREKIGLTIVGNEAPLVHGIRDAIKAKFPGHFVFGPDKRGAQLEGSKVFSDSFMREAKIPHGESVVVQSLDEALKLLPKQSLPLVIKADGLAAGKGVSIHHDIQGAKEKLEEIFVARAFGESGSRVLLQKFLKGQEASLFALVDGKEALLLPTARDYKRALDNDAGENTGGMGAYAPSMDLTDQQKDFVRTHIIQPVIDRFEYRGLLYVGLMIQSEAKDGVAVVEFNCRFGDPETQSILPLIEGDLVEYLLWTDNFDVKFPLMQYGETLRLPHRRGACVNAVVAAKGYPAAFEKNIPLAFPENKNRNLQIIGAGIEERDGQLFSTGGRIANIVAYGKDVAEARQILYAYLENFKHLNATTCERFYWRSDIAEMR